jgi:hypothetical protein
MRWQRSLRQMGAQAATGFPVSWSGGVDRCRVRVEAGQGVGSHVVQEHTAMCAGVSERVSESVEQDLPVDHWGDGGLVVAMFNTDYECQLTLT